MNKGDWPQDGLEFVNACPVCRCGDSILMCSGLTDQAFSVAPGEWTLYQCVQCRSAYLNPRPTMKTVGIAYQSYYTHETDDVSPKKKNPIVRLLHGWMNDYINARYGLERDPAIWGGRWALPLLPSYAAKANAKLRHLPRRKGAGGRLLDVGFGNGDFLKLATDLGWRAEGIDSDPKAVDLARTRGLNVALSTVEELPRKSECYDIITLSHVVEHVHDPVKLINELHRLLKPGGVLWLETPNLDGVGFRRFGCNWRGLEPPRHLVLFTLRGLKRALEEAGFCEINQEWNGMVVFSNYAQSCAIREGRSGCSAVRNTFPSFYAVFDEVRGFFQPSVREYITLVARKW